jgi:CyaY protein
MGSAPASTTTLSDAEYDRLTRELLGRIESAADRWLQSDLADVDTHRTGGLLELAFANGSKIVVNTQPPLHEVWLAARAGGFHYRWSGTQWIDTRDGGEFVAALERHASTQAGAELRLNA